MRLRQMWRPAVFTELPASDFSRDAGAGDRAARVTGLLPDTPYYFRIVCVNKNGATAGLMTPEAVRTTTVAQGAAKRLSVIEGEIRAELAARGPAAELRAEIDRLRGEISELLVRAPVRSTRDPLRSCAR